MTIGGCVQHTKHMCRWWASRFSESVTRLVVLLYPSKIIFYEEGNARRTSCGGCSRRTPLNVRTACTAISDWYPLKNRYIQELYLATAGLPAPVKVWHVLKIKCILVQQFFKKLKSRQKSIKMRTKNDETVHQFADMSKKFTNVTKPFLRNFKFGWTLERLGSVQNL